MYYFENRENQIRLEKILKEWRGTPFRHHCGVKGLGCDCINFVAKVFEEMGFGPFKIMSYPKDWHLHRDEELLLNGIKSQLKVDEIGFGSPMNGDIMLFKFGKVSSHASIFYDDHLYQSITNVGVEKIHWRDNTWFKRKTYNLRIISG